MFTTFVIGGVAALIFFAARDVLRTSAEKATLISAGRDGAAGSLVGHTLGYAGADGNFRAVGSDVVITADGRMAFRGSLPMDAGVPGCSHGMIKFK